MAKEDLLSKQINQMGFFLRKILEKITNSDSLEETAETVLEINIGLKETLGFTLEEIEKLPVEEVVSFLLQYECFSVENLELFADILVKVGKVDFHKKALCIYEYVNLKTATFSMDRNFKIQSLKDSLL